MQNGRMHPGDRCVRLERSYSNWSREFMSKSLVSAEVTEEAGQMCLWDATATGIARKPRPRIALLSNPKSTGNLAQLPRIREYCSDHPDVFHYEVEHASQIGEAMKIIARVRPKVLAINGGDGTVQAALTELHNGDHFDDEPLTFWDRPGDERLSASRCRLAPKYSMSVAAPAPRRCRQLRLSDQAGVSICRPACSSGPVPRWPRAG